MDLQALETLSGDNWLDDMALDAIIQLAEDKRKDSRRILISTTYFTQYLARDDFDYAILPYKSVKGYSYLLFPFRIDGNHWVLGIVSIKSKKLTVYNSIRELDVEDKERHLNIYYVLIDELERFFRHHKIYTNSDKLTLEEIQGPQQRNASDCGVFVAEYARRWLLKKKQNFSQTDMPKLREKYYKMLEPYARKNKQPSSPSSDFDVTEISDLDAPPSPLVGPPPSKPKSNKKDIVWKYQNNKFYKEGDPIPKPKRKKSTKTEKPQSNKKRGYKPAYVWEFKDGKWVKRNEDYFDKLDRENKIKHMVHEEERRETAERLRKEREEQRRKAKESEPYREAVKKNNPDRFKMLKNRLLTHTTPKPEEPKPKVEPVRTRGRGRGRGRGRK